MASPHAAAAKKTRDQEAAKYDELDEALTEQGGRVEMARRNLTAATLGDRRIAEIERVIVSRHGADPMPTDLADQYAPAVISAALWSMCGLPGSGDERHAAAIAYARKTLPTATPSLLAWLARHSAAMTAQDVARALQVDWLERERLGLTLIGAEDVDDDEYDARRTAARKQRDAVRQRARRQSAGGMTADERNAHNAAKRDALKRLAAEYGVSESTIRRRITAGDVAEPEVCKSRVRASYIYPADATFSKRDLTDARGDGAGASSPVSAVTQAQSQSANRSARDVRPSPVGGAPSPAAPARTLHPERYDAVILPIAAALKGDPIGGLLSVASSALRQHLIAANTNASADTAPPSIGRA